jgi:hypothetical protein
MSALALRKKIRALSRLPAADRRLLVRAALWLPAVDLGLRTLGFTRVRRLLARGASPAAGAAAPAERPGQAERLAWIVAAAARHHLYPVKCLTRSLVLWHLLARRGIAADLRIGVHPESGSLRAHAWVEHRGRLLAEPEGVDERFAALALPAP